MAPTSRPWAVTVEARSTTTTFAPASAADWAAAQPAMPAPITATSHSMVLVFMVMLLSEFGQSIFSMPTLYGVSPSFS